MIAPPREEVSSANTGTQVEVRCSVDAGIVRTRDSDGSNLWARLSLRARLLLLTVALLALGLTVTSVVLVNALRSYQLERLDRQLEAIATVLARRVPGTASGSTTRTQLITPRVGLLGEVYIAYLNADGSVDSVLSPSNDAPASPVFAQSLTTAEVGALAKQPFDAGGSAGTTSWRVVALPRLSAAPPADTAPPAGSSVVVAASLDEVNATVHRIELVCLFTEGLLLILLAGGGWFAIGAGLAPLRQMERTAVAIAGGDLTRRVPRPASPNTEVGRLAMALNGMLLEIEQGFAARAESEARMRRFLADVSHELRTPLFGIKGFTELYRMGGLAESADVDRTMARIESEAERLVRLAEDLLLLTQLEEHDGDAPLQLGLMDLRILAADAYHDLHALDPSRPIRLSGPEGGSPGSAPVYGDEAGLRRVVSNLVGNVIAHTPAGSAVRIGVGTVGEHAVLEVGDQGPGLTAEQAGRVFERFYRVERSRNRACGGGAGLGLAIVQSLIAAHGGSVVLRTAPGEGATFRLVLPAIADDGQLNVD